MDGQGLIGEGGEVIIQAVDLGYEQVDDTRFAFNTATCKYGRAMACLAAEAFINGRAHDEVGDAGFIFDGDEDNAACGAWALAHEHKARDCNARVMCDGGTLRGGYNAALGKVWACEGEGMGFEREAGACIITYDQGSG